MKLAAIDVGSNSVKLLLARVFEDQPTPYFKKESFVRMPLRLGEEVFTSHRISLPQTQALIQTMAGFKSLIEAYGASGYLACATSAMREAENGEEVAAEIRRLTGIELKIVDGSREAQIIYSNHAEETIDSEQDCVYVDVGGGSTEVSVIRQGRCLASSSFSIGTIRLLKKLVDEKVWQDLRHWLKTATADCREPVIIGSGGNINKVFRLARKKEGRPLSYKKLKSIFRALSEFSLEERIRLLGLRPDRADVIVPACEVFVSVMKWCGSDRLYVPQVGLSDGLIHILYEEQKRAAASSKD